MPNKRQPNYGFKCPECPTPTPLDVVFTVGIAGGVVRVRLCPVCFHLARTEEKSQGTIPNHGERANTSKDSPA